MIGKTLKRLWTHLQIAFYDNYTAEGFEKTNKKFELPANLAELDPTAKRRLTICNLFANQNLSIFEIVNVLDSSLHQVVPALIEKGLIKERRRNLRGGKTVSGAKPVDEGRSSTLSILPNETTPAREAEPRVSAAKACESEEVLEIPSGFVRAGGNHRLAS